MSMTRRSLLRSISIAAAAGAPVLARPQDLPRFRINLIPVADVAPVYVGLKLGYFRQEGLDLVITPSTGGAAGIPGLVGGAFDMIYGNNVSTVLAVSRGLDLKIVSAATRTMLKNSGIVARKGEGLRDGKSLEGKTIAVNTRNNAIWLYANAWVRSHGGDPSKVNFKEVAFPQMVDAIKQKQIDGAFVIQPFFGAASTDATLEVIGYPYEVQPNIQIGVYVCTGAAAREQADRINRFLRGLKHSNAWYDANLKSEQLSAVIAEYTKQPMEVLAKVERGPAYKSVDLADLQQTVAKMRDAKLLADPVDMSKSIYGA